MARTAVKQCGRDMQPKKQEHDHAGEADRHGGHADHSGLSGQRSLCLDRDLSLERERAGKAQPAAILHNRIAA
jgi:hypothetical protein